MNHATDSCAGIDELLLDFAYGELAAGERRTVEGHLSGCARCRDELDAMQGTRRVMQVLQPEPVPAGGLESLLAYAEQATAGQKPAPARPRWLTWLIPALPVGGLLVAILVVVGGQQNPAATLQVAERADEISPAPPPPSPAKAIAAEPSAPAISAPAGGSLAMESKPSPARSGSGALDEGGGGGHVDTLLERRRQYRASRGRAEKAKKEASPADVVATSVATSAAGGLAKPAPMPAAEPAPRPLQVSQLAAAAEAAREKRREVWADEEAARAESQAAMEERKAEAQARFDSLAEAESEGPMRRTAPRPSLAKKAAARDLALAESDSKGAAAGEAKSADTRIAPGHAFMVKLGAARAAADRGEHLRAVELATGALASAPSEEDRRSARVLVVDEARRFLEAHPGHARAAEIRTARARALEGLGRYSEARAEWAELERGAGGRGSRPPAAAPLERAEPPIPTSSEAGHAPAR